MKSLFTPLRTALLIALLAVAAAGFLLIPADARLPVRWGIDGQANGFAPRDAALLFPLGLAAFSWALIVGAGRVAKVKDANAGRRPLGVSLTAFAGLALVIEAAIVLVGLGYPINVVQTMAIALGVMFSALGNALAKSEPKSLTALRLPQRLNDPERWRATHRLCGGLLALGGGVLVVAALLAPAPTLVWWILAAALLPVPLGIAVSMFRANRP